MVTRKTVMIRDCEKWLHEKMVVWVDLAGDGKGFFGVIGEIDLGCFYIWHNNSALNGGSGHRKPRNYGFKYSWCISFGSFSLIRRVSIKEGLKNGIKLIKPIRGFVEAKRAEITGFELRKYKTTDKDAVDYGKESGNVLKIDKNVIRTLKEFYDGFENDEDNSGVAVAFMLGERNKIITNVIELQNGGGCEDTPHIRSESIARALNVMIATGYKAVGFCVVRQQNRNYNGYDSFLNNLKTWGVLFPNCIGLLVAENNYAWRVKKDSLEILKIVITKPKVKKKGGDKHGSKGKKESHKRKNSSSCTGHEDNQNNLRVHCEGCAS